YFPAKVAMPVVFGMLFQQILASVFNKLNERQVTKV
ncbi:MAG: bile acid:sodium symporter family protein, partial [Candidatus Kurthia intestinigallinarum]